MRTCSLWYVATRRSPLLLKRAHVVYTTSGYWDRCKCRGHRSRSETDAALAAGSRKLSRRRSYTLTWWSEQAVAMSHGRAYSQQTYHVSAHTRVPAAALGPLA